MNIEEYIESGILELYVAGALSEKESQKIYEALLKHPELLVEVIKIESSIIKLTASTSPSNTKHLFKAVKEKLGLTGNSTQVITLNQTKWFNYAGWAASLVLGAGLFWVLNQNNQLKTKISTSETHKELLETEIENSNLRLVETKKLLSILRDETLLAIPLAGQTAHPEAYAKVYWDKKKNRIYLDAQGLPKPPRGKVYQVWSLKLNPLAPTSLGVIANFDIDDTKIFTIENTNTSEAFGITLEPAGGSKSPTLEQLYTLGTVAAIQ